MATEFVCRLPACLLPGPVNVSLRCTGSTKLPEKLVALVHAISLETGRDLFPSYCEAVLGIVTDKGGVLQSILILDQSRHHSRNVGSDSWFLRMYYTIRSTF